MAPLDIIAVNAHLDDDERWVVVYTREEDGSSRRRRVAAQHATWHRAEDVGPEALRQLKGYPTVSSVKVDGAWIRVVWTDKWRRRDGLRGMRANRIESYEGDVDPVLFWLVESRAKIAKPRRCYLDVEADSRVPLSRKEDMRILSWAVVDEDGGEVVGCLERDDDESERALLAELARVLDGYDQICVWEGDWAGGAFDSVVVPARWRARGVPVDERRWIWLNQLAVWKRMNMHSAESGVEKESFKLEDIAHEQIGEGKEKIPDFVRECFGDEKCKRGLGAMTWDLWSALGRCTATSTNEFRDLLIRYNARDAQLLRKLEARKGYIAIFQATCELCGIVPETRSLQPTRQMDGFMLRLGREQGARFPTRAFRDEGEVGEEVEELKKFKGAFVLQPRTLEKEWRDAHGMTNGILRDVHVCDFAGMYPSIMLTFNLGAEMKVGWAKDPSELAPSTCLSPGTGLVTRTDAHGMITLALRRLIAQRKEFADLAASLPPGTPEWQDAMSKSTACKVTANSFYGAGGSPYSRFNDRDCSEATTQNGVHFLKLTAAEGEKRGMNTVYSDSITAERTVVLKDPDGWVRILPVVDFWKRVSVGSVTAREGKESAPARGWRALTRAGWRPVRSVIRHYVRKAVHQISTKHGQVRVTKDHSIMVAGREVTPIEFVESSMRFDTVDAPRETQPEVIDLLEHVKDFERVVLSRGCELVRRFVPDGDDHMILSGGQLWKRAVRVKRFYRRDSRELDALLNLVGAYVCDGSASIGGVTTSRSMLSFCKAKFGQQRRIARDLRVVIDGAVSDPFWTETVYVVRSSTITAACLFAALCGYKSSGKRLPAFAFALEDRGYRVLRASLERGDGFTDASGMLCFTSTSQQLIAGVSYLLSQNEEPHGFHFRAEKNAWSLRTRKGRERPSRYMIAHQVESDFEGDVFDLSVDGDHTFVDGVGRVVLHNTDSCMVVGPSIRAFAKFVDWLNAKRFPEEVARHGCVENHVKIAFEKSFSRIVFISAKRYCGKLLHYKWSTTCNHCVTAKGSPGSVDVRTLTCRDCGRVYDEIPRFLGKPEIKGLEYKRGDKGKLARELQGRVIDFLVGGVRVKNAAGKEVPINADRGFETPTDDVAVYRAEIERARNHVLGEPLTLEEVRWSKGISKSLREYGKDATEAHVRAAKMLVERGHQISRGMRVEYVVVDGSVSPMRVVPAEDYAGECDRFHLWEKVYAPTQHLLEKAFPDEDWKGYADVRPKGRAEKDKSLEGQLGMFVDHDGKGASAPAALTRVNANEELAVAAYSSKPLVVRVPEDGGGDVVERVAEVLRVRSGSRRARIGIVTRAGTVSLTKTEYLVNAGPALFAEVEAAIAGPIVAP